MFFFFANRCVPSMAQTFLSINAGTAAQWLFSSALAPRTSAMPATMISSEWQASPKKSCPTVLQVLSSSVNDTGPKKYTPKWLDCVYAFLWQGPKENSLREQNVLYMWFTHLRGRNLPWGVGFVEMPTPSKDIFTENQFVYCDFYLWLKLSGKAQLLHGRVSWTLDQVSAPSRESSALLLCWHQCPGSDNRVLWLMWIQSNKKNEQYNLNGKTRKKKKTVTCLHAAVVFPRLL